MADLITIDIGCLFKGSPVERKATDRRIGQALLEGIGRLMTLIIQETDLPYERLHRTLKGITCEDGMVGQVSCLDAWARFLEELYPERSCPPTD